MKLTKSYALRKGDKVATVSLSRILAKEYGMCVNQLKMIIMDFKQVHQK